MSQVWEMYHWHVRTVMKISQLPFKANKNMLNKNQPGWQIHILIFGKRRASPAKVIFNIRVPDKPRWGPAGAQKSKTPSSVVKFIKDWKTASIDPGSQNSGFTCLLPRRPHLFHEGFNQKLSKSQQRGQCFGSQEEIQA